MSRPTLDPRAPWRWLPFRDGPYRYHPSDEELELVRALFPSMNPRNVRWGEVGAVLIGRGHAPEVLACLEIGQVMALLRQTPAEQDPRVNEWPRQADVAEKLGMTRARISQLLDDGELRDNGKAGHARRVDPQSVLDYCNRTGTAYNQT